MLVFESEIERSLNPKLWHVQPEGVRLGIEEFVSRVEKQTQGARITALRFSDDPCVASSASLQGAGGRSWSVTVNPYNGAVLGSLAGTNTIMPKVHQFHTNLLLGKNGKLITGTAAIMLVILALTGLVLWWPRKIWKLDDLKSGKRVNFDLHNALGFWSSVFMLIFGVTGIVIHWDDEASQLVGRLTGMPPRLAIPTMPSVNPDAHPMSAALMYEAATKAVPGAAVNSIQGLNSNKAPVRVTMRFPEDRTPAGRTNVYIHPVTAEVLMAQDSRTAPPAYRWVKLWNRQFHTGDEFGMPSRILTCLASLSLPLLAVTGPLIWCGRIRRRRGAV
ncbi:MAG: putative iron-regulated rane protein [Verrucomicrobiaceae bacterium]|nr:putative iron-regulated rane protein [Verrucomicrobiaceae bacterium]